MTNSDPKVASGTTGAYAIYILKAVDLGTRHCIVSPEELAVAIGDQVMFKNLLDVDVRIAFATPGLFGVPSIIMNPAESQLLTVQNIEFAAYAYDVFCGGEDAFPDKASRPRIVVYK
jgi:hypothetical protein